jgi:hypothetical protein
LKDGKVRIEWDGIEYGITRDLIAAGIPAEDIVAEYGEDDFQSVQELVAA